MSALSRGATRALATLTLVLVASCGGRSERTSNDDDDGSGGSDAGAGSGGTSGTGGTTSGGTSGASGTTSGGTSGTGNSTSGGTSGSSGTGTGGDGSCFYAGQVYADGVSFPADDGCNTCFCMRGSVGCTLVDCPPSTRCDALSMEHAAALERAKLCMFGDPNACSITAPSSIVCGCPTFVNEPYELEVIQAEAFELNCGSNIICGACPSPPVSSVCVRNNTCMDIFVGD